MTIPVIFSVTLRRTVSPTSVPSPQLSFLARRQNGQLRSAGGAGKSKYGWFNATRIAEHFGRRLDFWLKTQETQDYIDAVMRHSNTSKRSDLIRTKRGNNGGTWLHPQLAVAFARWLNPDFAVWCDIQIAGLLKGQHPHFDWKRVRHEAASSFKVMQDILAAVRADQGKPTEPHHFINEAKLINWALQNGAFAKLDRETLSVHELDLLAKLELKNATLIGRGMAYADRKKILKATALDLRVVPFPMLPDQQDRAA